MAASLSSLLRQTHITSHDEMLTAANAALKTSKTDETAQYIRVVALLKLDRFEDAVRAVEGSSAAFKDKVRLEYAYALYKAGEWEKAEKAAAASADGSRGLLHILAQTAYRLEKFEEAAKLYQNLASPGPAASNEENDLRINRGAVDAQLEWSQQGHLVKNKRPQREDLEAFESAYNIACASIARGELGQSEVLLRRAKDLCNASEDLSDEEKETELVPIIAQLVYVLCCQGRSDEAKELYNNIDADNISDKATKRIVKINNIVSSDTTSNPYLAHRAFHEDSILPKNDKPFQYQSSILQQDEYVMDLLSLKYSGVATSTSAQIKSQSSSSTPGTASALSALNAAAHAKNATGKAALRAILPLLEQRPADVGLLLTIIQLYVLTNNHGSAIHLLEKFLARLESSNSPTDADVRFAPGLVGTLVSLYALQGRKPQIRAELAKAAKYWRSKTKGGQAFAKYASLSKAAGASLLHSTDPADLSVASAIFTDLHTQDASDKASTAGLIAALALTNPENIQFSDVEKLTDPSRLVLGVDAEALEAAGIAQITQPTTAQQTKKRPADEASKEQKNKKPKPSKMPKDYDPNKKMDSERWLPLRDRSYWKPKGRKAKARQAGLSQGGIVDERPATPSETVKASGGKNDKKKKKGKAGK